MKTTKGAAILVAGFAATAEAFARCRALPGDETWPSPWVWDAFNWTVGGQLVATVPIGSVCHEPTYDAGACAALRQSWTLPTTQYVDHLAVSLASVPMTNI